MNDERRVAKDALVVPLWGRKGRVKRRDVICATTRFTSLDDFSERRERRSFFEDLALNLRNAQKRKRKTARSRKNARGAPNAANVAKKRLLADAEAFDERNVTRLIFAFQVVEKAATIANHLKETATGRVILFVDFHVFGQRVDFFRQQRDLDFRGPDVGVAAAVFGDDRLFFFFGHNRHVIHLFVWEID